MNAALLGQFSGSLTASFQLKAKPHLERVKNGFTNGSLWKYCSSFESYHCPGDLRFKLRKPGAHWAYDRYSKTDGMNGGQWNIPSIEKRVIDADTHNWVDPLAAFHLNANTMGFADGHVESHRWLEATTLKAATAAERNVDTPFAWAKAKNDRDFA